MRVKHENGTSLKGDFRLRGQWIFAKYLREWSAHLEVAEDSFREARGVLIERMHLITTCDGWDRDRITTAGEKFLCGETAAEPTADGGAAEVELPPLTPEPLRNHVGSVARS